MHDLKTKSAVEKARQRRNGGRTASSAHKTPKSAALMSMFNEESPGKTPARLARVPRSVFFSRFLFLNAHVCRADEHIQQGITRQVCSGLILRRCIVACLVWSLE